MALEQRFQIPPDSPFGTLPPDIVAQLFADAQQIDLPRNATLYYDEQHPRCALVLSGVIRMYMTSPDGRQVTVRYARSGEIIGLAAILGGNPPVQTHVLTDAKLLMLNGRTVIRLGQDAPLAGWFFAREVARRLYDTLDALAINTFGRLKPGIDRCNKSNSNGTPMLQTIMWNHAILTT